MPFIMSVLGSWLHTTLQKEKKKKEAWAGVLL
jgi:hypothetical protein